MALIYARRPPQLDQNAEPASLATPPLAPAAYADPSVCASCHEQIARTYSLTGMARSFSKVSASEFQTLNRLYHKASDRHYAIVERDGQLYQRRHQIGFDGKEANALELEAHYVVGSGNHARTLVHRTADGRLVQLPVSWYADVMSAYARTRQSLRATGLLGDEPGIRPSSPSGLQARHRRGLHVVSQRLSAFARGKSAKARRGRSRGAALRRFIAGGHRLPTLSWAGTGARRGNQTRRPRGRPADDCEPGNAQPRTAARDVHAVPPGIDEQPAAISDSPSRASAVFVYTRKGARRLLHSFRSRAREWPRRQIRNCKRRIPPAQVGLFSAQRDDVRHLSRPARHSARPERSEALCGGLSGLPSGDASWRYATGPGRGSRRHLPRLPYAEAADRRRGPRGHDRSLHSASTSRRAICSPIAPRRTASRTATIGARSSLTIRRTAGVTRERAVSGRGASAARLESDRRHSAGFNKRLSGTVPRAQSSTTSSRARTRRPGTMTPISDGPEEALRRDRHASCPPSKSSRPRPPRREASWKRRRRSKRLSLSVRPMRMPSPTWETCICGRTARTRPTRRCSERSRSIRACRGRTTRWDWQPCAMGRFGAGRDTFSRGDPASAGPRRGAQQSGQSTGGAEGLCRGGLSFSEGDRQRSKLCRSAPQLWFGPGADEVV